MVGVLATDKGPVACDAGADVAAAWGRKWAPLLASLGVTGKAGESVRLPGLDASEVVGEARVEERRRPRPAHQRLAEVAHVEQAHRIADGGVFGQHSPTGELQRHAPATELGELRTEGHVTIVQR